jgi:DnaK suppressor protein
LAALCAGGNKSHHRVNKQFALPSKERDAMKQATGIDYGKYKELLLRERAALNQSNNGTLELPGSDTGNDVLDSGDRSVQEHEMDLQGQLLEMKSDRLDQIEAALQRIERGDYGLCTRCGEQINPKRLEAMPETMTCIEHARAADNIETPSL